jgi:hypothetical protein
MARQGGFPTPERTTFYGAREIGVANLAGHAVTFAQTAGAPQI